MFAHDIAQPAKTLWNYLKLNQKLEPSDAIIVLGSHDLRVPRCAASLFHQGLAPIVISTGGIAHNDDLLKTRWNKTEAEMFNNILLKEGVPPKALLKENAATNTGENFVKSKAVLEENNVHITSAIVVTKPYMERRALATGQKQWPGIRFLVTSPQISFEDYFNQYNDQDTSPEDVLNIMMGDLQRIDVYGKKGFQIPQVIPEEVWRAFEALRELGFTKRLL